MIRLLAALVFCGVLTLPPTTNAQTAGAPLQVRTGEVYTVSIESTQSTGSGEQAFAATTNEVLALNILDAERRIWRYTPVSVSYSIPSMATGPAAAAGGFDWTILSEALSAFLRIATDVGFECSVDEYGRCVELSNWPLWRDRTENFVLMFDAFLRLAPTPAAQTEASAAEEGEAKFAPTPEARSGSEASDAPDAEAEAAPASPGAPPFDWARMRGPVLRGIARLLDGVDSRDVAIVGALPGANLQGRVLTLRRRDNVVDEVEMPFGAPPLRFTGTMQLERIDRRNNAAIVVRRVALDSDSARASLQSMAHFITTNLVEPVAAASAVEGESAPDAATFTGMVDALLDAVDVAYEESTTGVVDLGTGMARETTTDFTLTFSPPNGAEGDEPMVVRGRNVVRVTPGAPPAARLPRGE